MKLIVGLIGMALLPATAFARDKEDEKPLPDASLSDVRFGEVVNDVPFDKEKLAGKVVVVELWGVNCPPCIASLPDLAKLARTHEKKGLVVAGVECQNGSKEQILKLLKDARVKFPVMSGGSVPASTGGIPHVCVFNTSGKLVWAGNPHDKEFDRAVKKELRGIK
jgi:thiol-disulfide isomerase/thioredoxin